MQRDPGNEVAFHAVFLYWSNWNLEVLVFQRGKNREPGETEPLIEQAVSQLQLTTNETDIRHRAGIEPRPQHPVSGSVSGSRSVETITTSGLGTSGISHELTPHLLSQSPLALAARLFFFPIAPPIERLEQVRATLLGGQRSHHWAIPAGDFESQRKVK